MLCLWGVWGGGWGGGGCGCGCVGGWVGGWVCMCVGVGVGVGVCVCASKSPCIPTYSLDPELKEQLSEIIEKLLNDQTTVS